ncbi:MULTISPECIES: GNAT family N-acetyltransferase [Amycolatopsis]|uniref:GNAT family N-acetyltransferase n=1 Tax=Amycolatopsis tucumanensis TaxID=401106 RepID=A0ABP7IER3_9PSEU|nr:GNAT family N-acetyltransferase [Amycolatopsis tucumanensis]MCF6426801.1 GNAT family N-acetyltransferase [Amycolatopsis tucumanensis]
MRLETERLILRPLTPADADLVADLDSDPEVMRYLGDAAAGDVAGREGYFAAVEKAGGEFTGWFEFRPLGGGEVELGYRLRRRFWGRGYATEGARALIAHGFAEGDVERVVAFTMAVNTGSRRVMEKSGLRYVRTFHEDWPDPLPGAEHGDVEYALTKDDWIRQHGLP